ncbi:MAG TPA: tetratricopeptide repeat protein [Steroidobacteraceae bacterium]|nr:tetratricopeptide repeat protein [Steroidobacteraceae bacterium]
MQTFGLKDIERTLGLSRNAVRRYVELGFVKPSRAKRGSLQFSFQDLIVLRTARALSDSKVPPTKIRRALQKLRRDLPSEMPLSGLQVTAEGDQVVVREGKAKREVDTGQYVLAFDVAVSDGQLAVMERREQRDAEIDTRDADDDWLAAALQLEETDPPGAIETYRQALKRDPESPAAWTNLGRLLHDQGHHSEAQKIYREGLSKCSTAECLYFNLGVLLEDLNQPEAAIDMYLRAVELDPDFADAHYNLARLFEQQHKVQHAIRHYANYRRLTRT